MQLEKERTGAYQSGDYFSRTRTEAMARPERQARFRHRLEVRAGAGEHRAHPHRAAVRAVHRRQVRRAAQAASTSTRSTRRTRRSWRASRAPTRGRRSRRQGGPPRLRQAWSNACPAERGKYIYRIARMLQERAREFAVIESMDGGKPIRESRDVDVPLAAAHFFYYAGWADKLEYAFPGEAARRRSASRARSSRGTSRC